MCSSLVGLRESCVMPLGWPFFSFSPFLNDTGKYALWSLPLGALSCVRELHSSSIRRRCLLFRVCCFLHLFIDQMEDARVTSAPENVVLCFDAIAGRLLLLLRQLSFLYSLSLFSICFQNPFGFSLLLDKDSPSCSSLLTVKPWRTVGAICWC